MTDGAARREVEFHPAAHREHACPVRLTARGAALAVGAVATAAPAGGAGACERRHPAGIAEGLELIERAL